MIDKTLIDQFLSSLSDNIDSPRASDVRKNFPENVIEINARKGGAKDKTTEKPPTAHDSVNINTYHHINVQGDGINLVLVGKTGAILIFLLIVALVFFTAITG